MKDESLRMGLRQDKEARKVSVVQEIMFKSTDNLRSSHQSEDRVESQCLTCARTATVSLSKTTFGGSL